MEDYEDTGVDKEAFQRAQERARGQGPGPDAQWYEQRLADAYCTAFEIHDRIVNNPALPEDVAEREGDKAFNNIIRHAYD